MTTLKKINHRKGTVGIVAALLMVSASQSAFSHVTVVTSSSKLRGNDTMDLGSAPVRKSTPYHVKSKRGLGAKVNSANGKTVVDFDRPVFAAGAYINGSAGKIPANASVQAFDKYGRPVKLYNSMSGNHGPLQWIQVAAKNGNRTAFLGVRSCCACIKKLVYNTPLNKLNIYAQGLTPVKPKARIARLAAGPKAYTPAGIPIPEESTPKVPPLLPTAAGSPAGIAPLLAAAPSSAAVVGSALPVIAGSGFNFLIPAIVGAGAAVSGGGGGGGGGTVTPPPVSPPPPTVTPPPIITPPPPSITPPITPPVSPPGTPETPLVPEPSALTLILPGLIPLLFLGLRRRKQHEPI